VNLVPVGGGGKRKKGISIRPPKKRETAEVGEKGWEGGESCPKSKMLREGGTAESSLKKRKPHQTLHKGEKTQKKGGAGDGV